MAARNTVVVCVHGANQSKKKGTSAKTDGRAWEKCLELGKKKSPPLLLTVNGDRNDAIAQYHATCHGGSAYPHYVGWGNVWYGDIWRELTDGTPVEEVFSPRLNESSNYDRKQRNTVLRILERHIMKVKFDELVGFYELGVVSAQAGPRYAGKTLYEAICARTLEHIRKITHGGEHDFVLLGHSMGCAACYNVLSHLSAAKSGRPLVSVEGALSPDYVAQVHEFAARPARCLGLITFGNYTGYNWCQRLNNRILHGELKRCFVYPDACGRWHNFFTVAGGDPYVLDDTLGDSMEGDRKRDFQDVPVWRWPGTNIGHGRSNWFRRKNFVAGVRDVLETHLYRPGTM